jgi:hypothetical protein
MSASNKPVVLMAFLSSLSQFFRPEILGIAVIVVRFI